MELFELLRHIRSNPLNPKASMAVDVRRIADEYPQLKTQGQVGALGHAYGTKVAGKLPMDMYERLIDDYDSPYDRRNNAVASRFFNDLEKTNPPNVSLDDTIRQAKRSILGMQDTKNPHPVPYNWDVKYNNSESPPPMKGFLKEEDPVRWYDNIHSILFPQANAGIIDYQPDNQQQNQQPIAPQVPDTPVNPNPNIDPPLVPDEIIIPVPDTEETSGPWYGGGSGFFVRSNAAYNDAGERVYHPLGGYWQYDGNHPNIKAANEAARNWANTGIYRTQEYTYDGIPLTYDPEGNSGQGKYVQPEGAYNGYSSYDAYLANTK
tara:strand:- start:507 stop:1466 length:960 start_codon:yes stop_codon:yes gene_type:complete